MAKSATAVESLEPREVFARFAEIVRIPRGSGSEAAIADFIQEFARKRGLETSRDEAMNIIVRKPASPGCEQAPGVILQAHLDMVWAKETGSTFDFSTQPIQAVVDGDVVRAKGTTLGADNGIGIAYALAALDSRDLKHPPLEALFTTSEETGMDGALALDVSSLRGSRLINMDSEEEGIFYVSCAGGLTARLCLPLERVKVEAVPGAAAGAFYSIAISGLRGGHSGAEIDKQRGNANRLMGRILKDLLAAYDVRLADIRGGVVDNAIPVSASATVFIKKTDADAIAGRLAELNEVFTNELKVSDGRPGPDGKLFAVAVDFAPAAPVGMVFTPQTLRKIVLAANLVPDGVASMDLSLEGQRLVESSSNFAVVACKGDRMRLTVSVRSSLQSKRIFLASQVALIAESLGGTCEFGAEYPAWRYDPDSELLKVFRQAYGNVYGGKEPKVIGIHAGLECGVFADKFSRADRKIDLISFGPDVKGAHTPDENVGIASTGRTWTLLKEALGLLCQA